MYSFVIVAGSIAVTLLTVFGWSVIRMKHSIQAIEMRLNGKVPIIPWNKKITYMDRLEYLERIAFTYDTIQEIITLCEKYKYPACANSIKSHADEYYMLVATYNRNMSVHIEDVFIKLFMRILANNTDTTDLSDFEKSLYLLLMRTTNI